MYCLFIGDGIANTTSAISRGGRHGVMHLPLVVGAGGGFEEGFCIIFSAVYDMDKPHHTTAPRPMAAEGEAIGKALTTGRDARAWETRRLGDD